MGLPNTQVLLDDGTGTFPINITSKTLLADGFSFSRGRQDWQGGVTAGQLSITLNNADGRFTPGSTILGTPSPIKVDQRIRITETVNGTTFTRFTGYVKSWPVAWPATVSSWSEVKLTATDAQARAERWVLGPVVTTELLADAPTVLYPLTEPASATSAADISGNGGPVLSQRGGGSAVPVAFNGSFATFSAGPYLGSSTSRTTSTGTWVIKFKASSGSRGTIWGPLAFDNTGKIRTTGTALSTSAYDDGVDHVAHLVLSGGTQTLYMDGASVGSAAAASLTWDDEIADQNFTGTASYAGFYSSALSGTRAAFHSSILLTGAIPAESSTARITRVAGYGALSTGTLDASLTTVPAADVVGTSPWTNIQGIADAEMGVVFVDGSGALVFHNRNRVATKSVPDITMSASYISPDAQPVTDDQQMINYLEAVSEATQITQVVRSSTSEASHGRYAESVTFAVQTDQEVLDRADWIIANFAEPTTRYGTLTINMLALTAAQQAAVLTAVEVDGWLSVVGAPSQNTGGTTIDVVVEGYAEAQTSSSWTLTCNVVSRSLFAALILDSATYGALDSNRLYV